MSLRDKLEVVATIIGIVCGPESAYAKSAKLTVSDLLEMLRLTPHNAIRIFAPRALAFLLQTHDALISTRRAVDASTSWIAEGSEPRRSFEIQVANAITTEALAGVGKRPAPSANSNHKEERPKQAPQPRQAANTPDKRSNLRPFWGYCRTLFVGGTCPCRQNPDGTRDKLHDFGDEPPPTAAEHAAVVRRIEIADKAREESPRADKRQKT